MTYRERRLARAERLREWAEKRAAKSGAKFAHAWNLVKDIPLGQPILVGHHSERRHRRTLERSDNAMRAAFESQQMADSMNSRAANIEDAADNAIYSDDPDAIERLTEKIANLEAERERRKALNTAYRKAHKAELSAITSVFLRSQAMPYPSYSLQNIGGNITRAKQRLAFLSGQGRRTVQIVDTSAATATARAGLVVTATMTTPSRPGKKPRAVWNVSGNIGEWRQALIGLGGSWYRGSFSFWEDPTADIESMCSDAEAPSDIEQSDAVDLYNELCTESD